MQKSSMQPHGQSDRNSSVFFKGDGCDPIINARRRLSASTTRHSGAFASCSSWRASIFSRL